MNQLISVKKENGQYLRVIDWIASYRSYKCNDFAYKLLNAEHSTISRLRKDNTDDDCFIRAVIRDWLTIGDDDPNDKAFPRTWKGLADCVEEVGLDGALAKDIRDVCAHTNQGMPVQKCLVTPCIHMR